MKEMRVIGTYFAHITLVRIAIQSQSDHEHSYHLPHQGLWFVLMLIALLLLLTREASSTAWTTATIDVDDRRSVRHRIEQDVDADRVAFH
jgi:hypothetical protein